MKYKFLFMYTLIFLSINLFSQSNTEKLITCSTSFISGKVILDDNTIYSGIIKLGNNDLLWSNLFTAKMLSHKNTQYVPEPVLKTRRNYAESSLRWIVGVPFRDTTLINFSPDYICDYGIINEIKNDRGNIYVHLQNGEIIKLIDKTGDLGNDLYIYSGLVNDPVKVKWSRINTIVFSKSSSYSSEKLGKALFGEIHTKVSSEIGIIDWDQQEKTNSDLLNGRNSQGSFKIPFNQIESILNTGVQGVIKLKSGSSIKATANIFELFTDFSNDLGPENRGIVLSNPTIGKICYTWNNFKQISFSEPLDSELSALNTFPIPKKLSGEIKTKDGKTYIGTFVYNIYKERNTDYLFGNGTEELSYAIPFWNIQKIEPKGEFLTLIYLKNNEKIMLGNTPDVTNENDGIIVFDKKPIYIEWKNIAEININY